MPATTLKCSYSSPVITDLRVDSRAPALFLFEETTIQNFTKGRMHPLYSHDLNLIQLLAIWIRENGEVFVATINKPNLVTRIASLDNLKNYKELQREYLDVSDASQRKPGYVITANFLAFTYTNFGVTIVKILIQAAAHFLENPRAFSGSHLSNFLEVITDKADLIITQTGRMRHVIIEITKLLRNVDLSERITLLNLKIDMLPIDEIEKRRFLTRERLGIDPSDLVFINAGGAWSWTNFLPFLEAFSNSKLTNIWLIQPALGQAENEEHRSYHATIHSHLNSVNPSIRKRIILGDNWQSERSYLEDLLCASDVGLVLEKQSLEVWQSYRVRILEYVRHNLRVYANRGTFLDDLTPSEELLFASGESRESYLNDLYNLAIQANETSFGYSSRTRRNLQLVEMVDSRLNEIEGPAILRTLLSTEAQNRFAEHSSSLNSMKTSIIKKGISLLKRVYFHTPLFLKVSLRPILQFIRKLLKV